MKKVTGLLPKYYWLSTLGPNDEFPRGKFFDENGCNRNGILRNWLSIRYVCGVAESVDSYIKRVKRFFPSFPNYVIKSWLFEHNGQIDEFLELPLEQFRFIMGHITNAEVQAFNPNYKDSIYLNLKQLEDPGYRREIEKFEYPMGTIFKYVTENKEWPGRPLILLSNTIDENLKINGFKPNRPIHILEGNRRFSIVKYYAGEIELKGKLPVYYVTLRR